jgi:hypothetical protein
VEHPVSRESLERFAAGAATRDEGRTIALHLLKGCAACAATLRNLEHRRVPLGAYDRSLDRFERGLRAEVEAPSGMLTVLRAVLKKPEHRLEEMLARR